MHLLLIEDDLDLGRALQSALKIEGLSSEWRRRAADAPAVLDTEAFDCVLLDLGLPDGSGFDLLTRWREQGCVTPIIVVTARGAVEDRLRGLDGGADDFVVKPFATSELVARIHAVMRRAARQASERWAIGDLVIEPRRHCVQRAGQPVALSPREFQILVELAREPGAVMAKNLLAQRMVPLGEALDSSALEVIFPTSGARSVRTASAPILRRLPAGERMTMALPLPTMLRTLRVRMAEPTLQRRGVGSVLIAFLVIWVVLLGYVYWQSQRMQTSAPGLDRFGDAFAESLEPIADIAQARAVMAATSQWLNARRQAGGQLPGTRLFELLDAQGRRVWASPALRDTVLPGAYPTLTAVEVGGIAHNVYESRSARWTLRVIEPLRTDAAFLAYNGRWLLPYLMLAFPIILGAVWLSVRTGLSPLQQLARSIAQRAPDDLSPLALRVRHRELKPLAYALDQLLERLKQKVERERFFVQDAAHEIRTPLAVITAQAHVLAHATGLQVREQGLQHLNHAVGRASHLAQQLLLLASLDEGRRPVPQRSDVAQAVRMWLAPMANAALARGIELELEAPDALMAAVDLSALGSVVDNLVDNAVRYGRTGGRIVVHLLDEGERLTLLVRDDGPGIAVADRERIFERFWRGSGHIDVAGSGLGLAIVRQAARGMGGAVALVAGLDGHGCGFRVSVPNADFRAG